MKLTLDYDFGNRLGPGWVLHLGINGKAAAMFYDHEPTAKEVIEFVNQLGEQIEKNDQAAA